MAPAAEAFGQLGGINLIGGGPSSTEYELDNPGSIARAPDGSFYVLDLDNNKVVKLSSTGEYLSAFGGRYRSDSGTYLPTALTLGTGADPDVFVSTAFDGIKRFTSGGSFIAKFGAGTIQGSYLAVDPSCGELYVSQPQANRVARYALGDNPATAGTTEQYGDLLETFGQGAGLSDSGVAGKLWRPLDIAFDSTGRVFVVDSNNGRVSVFKWTGNCASRTHAYDSRLGSKGASDPAYMSSPTAIAIDNSVVPSKIYVTTTYLENLVQAYTGESNGEPLPDPGTPPYNSRWTHHGEWGSTVAYGEVPGSGTDDLSYPGGIAVDGSDAWVAEGGNGRIHVYSGVSAATPFTTPVTTDLWGNSAEKDGYFASAGPLASAPDGSVWVVDRLKQRVQHFSARGQLLSAFGAYGVVNPEDFQGSPSGIALTPTGEVLISGTGNVNGIKRFGSDGSYLGEISWPAQGAGPIAPGPMTVDAAGEIFVWDYDANKVLKLDPDGSILAQFGSTGTGANDDSLYSFGDLAVTPDGLTVFVLDQAANRVKKFVSADGVSYTFAAVSSQTLTAGSGDGQLSGPTTIALDPKGGVLVSDSGNDRIERFAESDLTYVSKFGSRGFADDQMMEPGGVEFDHWGNLWVSDTGNDRVKRFGDAPSVAITTPAAPLSTEADSIKLEFSNTDPAADCDRVSGATVPLSVGANTISVSCTNAQGTGSASVSVTRTVAAPPPPPVADVALKLPKKLKLNKKRKLSFSVTCPDGCTVTPKLLFGKKVTKLKQLRVAAKPGPQTVTLTLSKAQGAKAKAWMVNNKSVYLSVSVVSYKATQGKSGKAKISK